MTRTRLQHSRSAGFTLVELVVIIVVLGIIAAVAIPKVGNLYRAIRWHGT